MLCPFVVKPLQNAAIARTVWGVKLLNSGKRWGAIPPLLSDRLVELVCALPEI